MKLKMFIGIDGKDIERQVNIWRKESPKCKILKSETTVSYHAIPDPSGKNQLQQRIAMAIWYDDGSDPETLSVPSPTPPPPPLRHSN